jgi:hypothetical protein
MTNKELQQRTEKIIKSLGSFDDWKRGKVPNPFTIGRTYAYNLARGKFNDVGKHGLAAMKEYFRELENDKENE